MGERRRLGASAAQLVQSVAYTTVATIHEIEYSFEGKTTLDAGQSVVGPFEAGFGSAQDNIIENAMGCPTPSLCYSGDGGTDTKIAQASCAENCGIVLPRWEQGGAAGGGSDDGPGGSNDDNGGGPPTDEDDAGTGPGGQNDDNGGPGDGDDNGGPGGGGGGGPGRRLQPGDDDGGMVRYALLDTCGGSRPRRGDGRVRRVAATPRPRRGYFSKRIAAAASRRTPRAGTRSSTTCTSS